MFAEFLASFETGVTNVSNFLWGGEWNGTQVLPLAPLVVLLLGAGMYFMVRIGFRPSPSTISATSIMAGLSSRPPQHRHR